MIMGGPKGPPIFLEDTESWRMNRESLCRGGSGFRMPTGRSISSFGSGWVPTRFPGLPGNSSSMLTKARMSTSHFSELLLLLESFNVRYLIVGGYAVMTYTEPRFTKDLDIWVDRAAENATRVFAALGKFGAPLAGSTADDFTIPDMVFQIGVAPVRIDIITELLGIEFVDAWLRRERRLFFGAEAWFIGMEDLLQNKMAVGRPMDLIDADELRLAARIRSQNPKKPE